MTATGPTVTLPICKILHGLSAHGCNGMREKPGSTDPYNCPISSDRTHEEVAEQNHLAGNTRNCTCPSVTSGSSRYTTWPYLDAQAAGHGEHPSICHRVVRAWRLLRVQLLFARWVEQSPPGVLPAAADNHEKLIKGSRVCFLVQGLQPVLLVFSRLRSLRILSR